MAKTRHLPKEPEELEKLARLRQWFIKNNGDSDDIAQIERWEKGVKAALIFNSLRGHEGLEMLIKHAYEEIDGIERVLMAQRPKDLSPDSAHAFAYETQMLHERVKLWNWFIDLFQASEDDLTALREEIDMQLEDEGLEEETPEEEEEE